VRCPWLKELLFCSRGFLQQKVDIMTWDILKDFLIVLVDIMVLKFCMTCFVLFLGKVVKG